MLGVACSKATGRLAVVVLPSLHASRRVRKTKRSRQSFHVRRKSATSIGGFARADARESSSNDPGATEPPITRKREREDRPSPSRPNTACRESNSKRPAPERCRPVAVAADRDCLLRCRSWCPQQDHQEGQLRAHRRRPRAPKARPRSRMLSSGEWQVCCARSSPPNLGDQRRMLRILLRASLRVARGTCFSGACTGHPPVSNVTQRHVADRGVR
jgi:hypothetical protein